MLAEQQLVNDVAWLPIYQQTLTYVRETMCGGNVWAMLLLLRRRMIGVKCIFRRIRRVRIHRGISKQKDAIVNYITTMGEMQ